MTFKSHEYLLTSRFTLRMFSKVFFGLFVSKLSLRKLHYCHIIYIYCLPPGFLIISRLLFISLLITISCGLWNFLYQHICHLYPSFPFHLALHLSGYIQFRLLVSIRLLSWPVQPLYTLAIRLAACSDCDRATLHPVDCIPFELPRTNASFDSRDSKKELP